MPYITRAHSDHVDGLRNGAPAPVYASSETRSNIDNFDIHKEQRHTIAHNETVHVGDMHITSYNVSHSHNPPAIFYKVSHDTCTMLYSSDSAHIEHIDTVLSDVDIYIGDGSMITNTTLL